jgi:hypothetical protein
VFLQTKRDDGYWLLVIYLFVVDISIVSQVRMYGDEYINDSEKCVGSDLE